MFPLRIVRGRKRPIRSKEELMEVFEIKRLVDEAQLKERLHREFDKINLKPVPPKGPEVTIKKDDF